MTLTEPQKKMLDLVCRTSGGGVAATSLNNRTMTALYNKGLVQGKSGQQWRVVHTTEGLQMWRQLKEKADANPNTHP